MTVGIIAFVCVIVGVLWGRYVIPRKKYDGSIDVTTNKAGVKVFSLNLNDSPNRIEKMDTITFKVIRK